MEIDPKTVQAMAVLARLYVSEHQLPKYQQDLEQVLEYMQQLKQVDTDGVKPLAHPLDLPTAYRQDAVTESDQRTLLQESAPLARDGFYLVPQVVSSGD